MIQLKEIRLRESAPNIGVDLYANRRTTSTFLVGAEGVIAITLSDGLITVATKKGSFGLPASACQWWKFAELVEPEPRAEKPDVVAEFTEPMHAQAEAAAKRPRQRKVREKES